MQNNNSMFITCKTALNVTIENTILYASINPYLGCEHKCKYCYVQAEKYSKGKDTFCVKVKLNIIDVLAKELTKYIKKYNCGIIYLGTASDPYQPVEQKFKLSHKILSLIFNHTPYNIHVFTKSKYILDDIELFIKFKNRINISITIITIDEKIKKIFEPYSSSIKERLECIKKLNSEQIHTGCAIMPILPYITDNKYHLENLIRALKTFKCSYIWWDYLTLRDNITDIQYQSQKERYLEIISKHFPELTTKYLVLYRNNVSPNFEYQKLINKIILNLAKKYNIRYQGPEWNFVEDKIYQKLPLF